MNDNNQSRFLRLCRKLDELTSVKNGESKTLLIIGIALLIAIGLGVTTPLLLVWLVSAASVVGGTMFWFQSGRHRKDKKREALGLGIRLAVFALTTGIVVGLIWIVYNMFKNFTPH